MPMPFSSMIVQAQYFLPFLKSIQQDLRDKGARSSYTFWADKIGFDNCFRIFTDLFRAAKQTHHIDDSYVILFIQRDFEKMDTTTGPSQYSEAFIPILGSAFGWKDTCENYARLKESMLFTTQAPIITPDGVLNGDHGTASGAEVTNGGETCCNEVYDKTVRKRLAEKAKANSITYVIIFTAGNGDDGCTCVAVKRQDVTKFKEIYTQSAQEVADEQSYRMQASKWFISDEYGLYCQNFYWRDQFDRIQYAYPAVLILNSIINPEHQYKKSEWDKDYRDLDIIEKLDNGRNL